jgi:hypothetical protein
MDISKQTITIVKTTITAKTRKLKADWTIDWTNQLEIKLYDQLEFAVRLENAMDHRTKVSEILNWCFDTFKYYPVLSKNILQFHSQKDLNWFMMKWT